MRRKKTNAPVILLTILVVLVVIAAAVLGGLLWFLNTHFFVGGQAYADDAEKLDLRDTALTVTQYEAIRNHLPEAEIRWCVPFQGNAYPDETDSLTVKDLTAQDAALLNYFPKLKQLNAAGCRDYDLLMQIQEQHPDLELRYTVDIGGKTYDQDTAAITCGTLSDEEIALLGYLPELKSVDATGCGDYTRIAALNQAIPGLDISYRLDVLGQVFTEADVSATFRDPDVHLLAEYLGALTHLESVHLTEPTADADALRQLMELYPVITFTWEKTVLGKTFHSGDTEYDFTGSTLATVVPPAWAYPLDTGETEQVIEILKEAMQYFPNAEKVILPACAFDNEMMAAFREEMRPEYKVVWTVFITKKPIRTDSTVIHSSALKVCFIDEMCYDLKYCEDAVVVDIGHSYVKYIDWLEGMPNLKYLILAHNWIKDLTPISSCKKLEYLELFWNEHIKDYTPLLGCTALKDVNISGTYASLEPIKQMTWLENLWANCCGITDGEYEELQAALPNTYIEYRGGDYTSYGWRDLQSYFDMRDFMGLGYNHW